MNDGMSWSQVRSSAPSTVELFDSIDVSPATAPTGMPTTGIPVFPVVLAMRRGTGLPSKAAFIRAI